MFECIIHRGDNSCFALDGIVHCRRWNRGARLFNASVCVYRYVCVSLYVTVYVCLSRGKQRDTSVHIKTKKLNLKWTFEGSWTLGVPVTLTWIRWNDEIPANSFILYVYNCINVCEGTHSTVSIRKHWNSDTGVCLFFFLCKCQLKDYIYRNRKNSWVNSNVQWSNSKTRQFC